MKLVYITSILTILMMFSCTRHKDESWGTSLKKNSLSIQLNDNTSRSSSAAALSDIENICFMIFDSNDNLEAKHEFDYCPTQDVVFDNLTAGKKYLAVIANYQDNEFKLSPTALSAIDNKADLDNLRLLITKGGVAFKQIVTMVHQSELIIPMENPVQVIHLDRKVVKLGLINDIDNGNFKIDSISFYGLTQDASLMEEELGAASQSYYSVSYNQALAQNNIYVLPVAKSSITYKVFGKTPLGVTQVIDGKITPALRGNNSYRLNLSKGEIADDGSPTEIYVEIDDMVGRYSAIDSVVTLKHEGGSFVVKANSYDSLDVEFSGNWIGRAPSTRANKQESGFEFVCNNFITANNIRNASITIYNKFDRSKKSVIKVRQQGVNERPKYYVVVVAGQSNAAGRDLTPYDPNTDAPHNRIFELGQKNINPPYSSKFTSASTLDVVQLRYMAQNLDSHTAYSRKSMHLYLGKEILQHIPEDYNVLVISVAYSGSGFTLPLTTSVGIYDPITMRPNNFPVSMPSTYRFKAKEGVIYNMLVDRVKYALSLDDNNKFVGVVWLQGEAETSQTTANPISAYSDFMNFAESFHNDINKNVPHHKLLLGVVGPNTWFNIDHTPARRNWHDPTPNYLQFARAHYYGSYKCWNPSTFINLPADVGMNPGDEVHFGQNAFRDIIAPLTVKNMIENGMFGGSVTADSRFVRNISHSEITAGQGSRTDADIQSGLIALLPFDHVNSVERNLSENRSSTTIVNHEMTLTDATGLVNSHKQPRTRKALLLKSQDGGYMEINNDLGATTTGWSVSFMMKRFNGFGKINDQFLLIIPGSKSGLFFHQYQKEGEGGHLTLSFQPNGATYDRFRSVTARVSDASYVRTNQEWIHYTYTYDNASRLCKVYMNGENTMTYTLPSGVEVNDLRKIILNSNTNGVDAHILDLYVWNRAISEQTAFKVYLRSYYGVDASVDSNVDIGDWEDGGEI